MRPRYEALVAMLALGGLGLAAALAGRSRGQVPSQDGRPSTFGAGPLGARGLLEAMQRLHIEVRRFRERPSGLGQFGASGRRQILVILNPTVGFSPPEMDQVLRFAEQSDLLLAGAGAEPLMRCFGYRVKRQFFDSTQAAPPERILATDDPWVRRTLLQTGEAVAIDSSRLADFGPFSCRVPPVAARQVLLATRTGGGGEGEVPVAVMLVRQRDSGSVRREVGRVILVAEEDLFRNRSLRWTAAGPWALAQLREYDRVIFEEYHHGFGASGSLAGAALGWSRRSPWGLMVWQLGLVGLVALLFGAVRFGPARSSITRRRRSPLEHVRALATALAAAGQHGRGAEGQRGQRGQSGSDVAIGALVRGLRRRLAPPGALSRGDWREWLAGLAPTATNARAERALTTLQRLSQPGQPAANVRLAANAVEDLWQELQP